MVNLDQMADNFDAHFKKNGWFVVDLINTDVIHQTRETVLKELIKLTKEPKITLETYHEFVTDDQVHTQNQLHMTEFYRNRRFGFDVVAGQIPFFKKILGQDLKVQRTPFLRITRPNKPQDNIGFHRDTFYGGSPHELSFLVPFVEINSDNALSVMTGSHVMSEELFPTKQIQNPDPAVVKGSPKHLLGFPYAPKMLDESITSKAQPVPLKLGQALIFSLSTLHGSTLNKAKTCRWSSDIRVMHAFAPVDCSLRPDYYEPLHNSSVTESADDYFSAQKK